MTDEKQTGVSAFGADDGDDDGDDSGIIVAPEPTYDPTASKAEGVDDIIVAGAGQRPNEETEESHE